MNPRSHSLPLSTHLRAILIAVVALGSPVGGQQRFDILITGGTADLDGNTLNVNGAGELIRNTGGNPVSALSDSFQVDGETVTVTRNGEQATVLEFLTADEGEYSKFAFQ